MSLDSIDETQRKAFESAWREGRPEPIERFLPPEDDARHLATLEELVHIELEFTWKSWRAAPHDAPTISPARAPTQTSVGPPRVESYLKRFPRLNQPEIVLRLLEQEHLARANWGDRPSLEEYRERFPDIIPPDWQPTVVAPDRDDWETIRAGAVIEPDVPDLPRLFGNYELLDVIGRGGMGIVYRARQVAADRTVALKVVRRDYLESVARDTKASALDRFHQEVQATARLEHKNIVSVYEVGDVDGEPFFSMRYIEGRSLAEILRDGPIPNREAATYMADVAQAVAAAHRQDILHRDIKPQNILIDAEADRPLVADFGLAKVLSSNEDLTQSGDIMGSPPYMSPEQARDSSKVTTRSDIYALGATLYHVLTGRPPFQAATALETMLLVTDQEPVPPRQLNPAIDRDLETICLKCLEKEPARRYESATALADEFRQYLDNKPIVARPVGTVGRAVRWCRRNPVTATLITSTAAFLILALVATFVGYIRTTAALRVAEASFQDARRTVDDFCTNVSENILLNQPNMQPLRRELLEQALGYYQKFLEERGDDPTIRDELALTYFRIGQISELIDAPDDALAAYRQALAMQQQLVAGRPADRELLDALGNTNIRLGGVLLNQKRWDEAAVAYRRAQDIRKQLAATYPEEIEYRRKLANTFMNQGVMERQRGEPDLAEDRFGKAQSRRRQILDQDSGATKVRRDLAMGCYNLANLVADKPQAARAYYDEAIELFGQVRRNAPEDLMNPYYLAICHRLRGALKEDNGERPAAAEDYQQALDLMAQLALDNPAVTQFRAGEARVNMNIGLLHIKQENHPAASVAMTRALRLLEDVVTQCPNTPDYERDLGVTLYWVAGLEMEQSQSTAAYEHLKQAHERFDRLHREFPQEPEYGQWLEQIETFLQDLERSAT
jgi:tetratricopeptide (TPR) repeat protein/tRNA A-37 threonylcarbamoyl transferase component Bud32